MTYTKGYPDVIVGYWRGIQADGQNTDDDSIFETKKANGEWQYITRIIKVGQVFKGSGFKLGEKTSSANPTGKPGFYKGKTKGYSGGQPVIVEVTSEMLSHDKAVSRSNVFPPSYSYRVNFPASQVTGFQDFIT